MLQVESIQNSWRVSSDFSLFGGSCFAGIHIFNSQLRYIIQKPEQEVRSIQIWIFWWWFWLCTNFPLRFAFCCKYVAVMIFLLGWARSQCFLKLLLLLHVMPHKSHLNLSTSGPCNKIWRLRFAFFDLISAKQMGHSYTW